jgi:glycosyltransferase involved in cell wall biosynthesis
MKYLSAVDDCFLDEPNGMARVAWETAKLMSERGHDVSMVATRADDGTEPFSSESDGIRIVRYPRPDLPALHPRKPQRTIAAAARATREFLAGEQWDVVHLHTLYTSAGTMHGLGAGPRYVATVHSPASPEAQINWAGEGLSGRAKSVFGRCLLNRLERDVLSGCESIHVLSEFTAALLSTCHDITRPIEVVPYWHRPELRRTHTRDEARRKLGWDVEGKIFFTVRRHGARQGIELAIEALAPLCASGRCRFVVAGDGPRRREFQELAATLGTGSSISFPGRISEEDLVLAYEAADLFVLPTLALECFGVITIEALALGCPVLASDAGAIPEVLAPILPEFIVPAGDSGALRVQAEAFLEERLVAPPAEVLANYARANFDRSALAPRLLKLLEGRDC